MQFNDDTELIKLVKVAKLPDWQDRSFKKNSEAIQVHSRGEIFYKIDRLFPNEHPESKLHRILSFESVTEGSFGRAANNVNRIFKNSSYTVEASERTLQIASAHTFHGKNFYHYFLDEWEKWALREDPNARIAFYPPKYIDRGYPVCAFVGSEFVKHIDEDTVVFISEEESELKWELVEKRVSSETFYDQSINMWNSRQATEATFTAKLEFSVIRAVYHVFDRNKGFYRIEQLKEANQFEVEHFPISKPFMPVTDVGGMKGKKGINKSFLYPFVPFGNLALLQHSQHTAVNFTFSFPRMSEVQGPCDAPGCNEGRIDCEVTEQFPEGWKPCRACAGTGNRANQTPYKIYIKKLDPSGMEGDNKHLEYDDVKYYTPETSILDYSKNEWKDYLNMAEQAVYVQQRVQTGNVESADSKRVTEGDMYSFLAKVGAVYFGKMRFGLQCIENYNVGNPSEVVVNKPYSYAILTEAEAFESLKNMLTSEVPILLKASNVDSFINKFISESSPLRKFIEVLKLVDPLLYYTNVDLPTLKSNGIITAEQWADHVFSFAVLQAMYMEDKNLFLEEPTDIAELVKEDLIEFRPKPNNDLRNRFIDSGNAAE
jgi:hypothetical protein